MQVLKRKKMYEQQRDQLCAQSFNIEQAAFAVDSIKSTQETVSAMKDASKQLKIETAKIDLSSIEDTQDDMEEMLFDMNEIQETLGRSYG
jgi:charged multivesicular body protein 5